MAKNTVFANSREVACKISNGKSAAAFPDPCWSPPSPPAGPVVLPYANTSKAKDLTKGSKTVLIGNKPIALKDKSCFKKSTGNEAATQSFAKGVVSATLTGETFFTSWSMNVMVEGMNVPRHMDITTHNHGCDPGNTATWPFIAEGDVEAQAACADADKAIEENCKLDKDEAKEFEENNGRAMTWKDKYCAKIKTKSVEQSFLDELKSCDERIQEIFDSQNPSFIPTDETGEKNKAEFIFNTSMKFLTKIHNGLDISNNPQELYKNQKIIQEAIKKLENINKFKNRDSYFHSKFNKHKDLEYNQEFEDDFNRIYKDEKTPEDNDSKQYYTKDRKDKHKNEHPDTVEDRDSLDKTLQENSEGFVEENGEDFAEENTKVADENSCLKARRCRLVPYKNTLGDKIDDNEGCCSGQTGHHLPPKSWNYEDTDKKNIKCKKYKASEAPVVCAEGTNGKSGSHGALHDALDCEVDLYRRGSFFSSLMHDSPKFPTDIINEYKESFTKGNNKYTQKLADKIREFVKNEYLPKVAEVKKHENKLKELNHANDKYDEVKKSYQKRQKNSTTKIKTPDEIKKGERKKISDEQKKEKKYFQSRYNKKEASIEDTINMTARSHQEAVGEKAGCNINCTKAQLKDYFITKCECTELAVKKKNE